MADFVAVLCEEIADTPLDERMTVSDMLRHGIPAEYHAALLSVPPAGLLPGRAAPRLTPAPPLAPPPATGSRPGPPPVRARRPVFSARPPLLHPGRSPP